MSSSRDSPGGSRRALMFAMVLFAAASFAPLPGAAVRAADCPFTAWMSYKGIELLRTPNGGTYLYVTSRTAIDADGAPRAYHPDDVGRPCGRTGVGLDCPANAGYPSTDWWDKVLAPDPSNPRRAFVQPSGPAAGFFVSKTALADPAKGERDSTRYVDASSVPYLVFPGPFNQMRGTGKLGDIGIALYLGNGRQTPFIVADIGPDEPLGEASIALFEALGGDHLNPRTGAGVPFGPTLYVVFPFSVRDRARPWPATGAEIAAQADQLLTRVGGKVALAACAARFQ
jgi:hypothetical protein